MKDIICFVFKLLFMLLVLKVLFYLARVDVLFEICFEIQFFQKSSPKYVNVLQMSEIFIFCSLLRFKLKRMIQKQLGKSVVDSSPYKDIELK